MEQRDLKFRFWDGKNMIDWSTACQTAFNRYDEKNGESHYGLLYLAFTNPDWVKMQYAGRKDKTGQEVFDGDVVNVFSFDRLYRIAKVWYDDTNAMWKLEAITKKKLMDLEYLGHVINADNRQIEIIGNIYENPELLQPAITAP